MNNAYQQHKAELVPTGADILGPFYREGAPDLPHGVLGIPDLYGDPSLVVWGSVLATDGILIAGAVLDVWQADKNGVYDNEGYKLRGKFRSDGDGTYRFETIPPGDYEIGPNEFRCAHIHVIVTAPGFVPLTTQLYFKDDPYNATDHWFNKDRVVGPDGEFDFVLAKEGHR